MKYWINHPKGLVIASSEEELSTRVPGYPCKEEWRLNQFSWKVLPLTQLSCPTMLNRHWPVLTSHTYGYRTISGLEIIIPHLDRLVSWSRGKEGSSVGGAGKGTWWNEGEPRWSNHLPVLVVSPCSLARSLIDGLGYDTAFRFRS